jgi:hypothetical protein
MTNDNDRNLTVEEVARDLRGFKNQYNSDRRDLRDEMKDGFSSLREAINGLSFVQLGVYSSEQRSQDDHIKSIKQEIKNMKDDQKNNRRLVIASFIAPIVTGLVLAVLLLSLGIAR